MSIAAFVDGVFTINSVDISDHVQSVTIDASAAEHDVTPINSAWDTAKAGRKGYTLNITFFDDFAATETDVTVSAAFLAGTNIPFTLKPTSAAISATNPEYQGTVVPSKLPIGGAAGDILMKQISLKGSGALVQDVTA